MSAFSIKQTFINIRCQTLISELIIADTKLAQSNVVSIRKSSKSLN